MKTPSIMTPYMKTHSQTDRQTDKNRICLFVLNTGYSLLRALPRGWIFACTAVFTPASRAVVLRLRGEKQNDHITFLKVSLILRKRNNRTLSLLTFFIGNTEILPNRYHLQSYRARHVYFVGGTADPGNRGYGELRRENTGPGKQRVWGTEGWGTPGRGNREAGKQRHDPDRSRSRSSNSSTSVLVESQTLIPSSVQPLFIFFIQEIIRSHQ